MTIKRRSFLTMLGAAFAAPVMPALAAPVYTPGAFAAAMAHAQTFPVISVGGLAKRTGLTAPQADAMIKELARRDMVKLVGPSAKGTVRAASKIMINDPWGLGRTSQPRPAQVVEQPAQKRVDQNRVGDPAKTRANLDPMLAYLHDLCRSRGMALHPRCLTVGAMA